MLHEGLGSVALWKDFPARLAQRTGAHVIAYSRFGYGHSDSPERPYGALEMHEHEAIKVLPELLRSLDIQRPLLLGHSDGASIALIFAGTHPDDVAGVVALAPHVFVEDMCLESIRNARQTYLSTDLAQKLARYHANPDSAFWLWNNVWLDPAFKAWNIERYLANITCPLLAIQGYEDEYGTMEQLDRIARGVPRAQQLRLEDCHHSPHRDQPDAVLAAVGSFAQPVLGRAFHESCHRAPVRSAQVEDI
jgi:pimeloyl-ACP methyl ester carboxylesterase